MRDWGARVLPSQRRSRYHGKFEFEEIGLHTMMGSNDSVLWRLVRRSLSSSDFLRNLGYLDLPEEGVEAIGG